MTPTVQPRLRRRRQKDRLKRRVRKLFVGDKCPERFADNRTPCSRWCCGNHRHFFKGTGKLTMRERRAAAPVTPQVVTK